MCIRDRNIRAGMDSPSLFFDEYRSAVYEEAARYKGRYHVRRIKKSGSPDVYKRQDL